MYFHVMFFFMFHNVLIFDVLMTGFELPHCGLRGELPLDGDLGVVLVCYLAALGCSMMSFTYCVYLCSFGIYLCSFAYRVVGCCK